MLIRSYKMKGFTMKYYNSKRFLLRIADGFGRAVLVAAGVFTVGAVLTASAADDWTDANNVTYTALKSIKGNGDGQGYLVTDIVPNCTNIVMMKFKPVSASSALFCARDKDAKKQFACYHSYSSSKNSIRIDRDTSQQTSTSTVSTSSDYLFVADYGRKTATIVQSGLNTDLFGKALGGNDTYDVGSPLVFFAMHKNCSGYGNYGRDYIYYFELYDSNTNLTHCLLPAMCNSDSVYGFYDTRTGTFHPQSSGSAFTPVARTVTVTGTCKKWIGRGADNKMSTDANWEGGVAPGDGDNLDFTLAPPLAEINADITGVTFGKLWIDDGDIPTFTGSLTVSGCNNRAKVAGNTSVVFLAGNYTWRGTETNWGDADAWTLDNAAATWADNNNAIFNTADATATLTADAEANSLAFNQNATVAGSATLTVPTVSVAADVSATISAPTAGALAKIGAGTLTLTENRTDAATTLSEGTLALTGTASLDWSKFTFGTDPAKPVRLDFGPEATVSGIAASATWNVGDCASITSVLFKAGGNWANKHFTVGRASGAVTTFINAGGDMMAESYFMIGHDGASASTVVVSGGTVGSTSSSSLHVIVGTASEGTLVVTNSGVFSAKLSLSVAHNANGTVNVSDGGFVHAGGDIVFHYGNANGRGAINLGRGGVIEAGRAYSYRSGLASFNFDGGTYRQIGNKDFFDANDTGGAIDVTVSENGGMLDNNGFTVGLPRTITGAGGITLIGSGTTTVSADQSYLGTTTVSNGTTLAVSGGVTFAGPVVFAAGSTFDIANYDGTTPVSASALALPSEGTVNLKLNGGAFGKGIYAICAAQGVTAEEGGKFSFTTENGESASWSVADGTLLLAVGDISGNYWTGRGGDGKMSTAANWLNGVPAEGDDIDFSVISADTTIIADAGHGFGAVTMGDGVITFTNAFAAASFSDTSKVAVGADSTVTINGDLVFSWSDDIAHPICNNVASGGVFRVTGSIIADSENRGYIVPCPSSIAGTIAAAGLVNNSSNSDDAFRLVRGTTDSSVNWEIGAAGISGTKRFVVSNAIGSLATIKAAANFTVSATIVQYRSLTLDTAGYTITLGTNTPVKAGGILPASSAGSTTIAGSGTVVANYDVDDLSTLAGSKVGPFTVANGATLALMSGSDLGTGLLTVEDGGALEVGESGEVTLGGDLALEDGAVLAFNWTERAVAPQLALSSGKTLTVNGAVKVKIAEGSLRPTGGEKLLTTCGGFDAGTVTLAEDSPKWVRGLSVNDGNIVLDVKPMGTVILFR